MSDMDLCDSLILINLEAGNLHTGVFLGALGNFAKPLQTAATKPG